VQAQDASAATLAVRVRSAGLTAADVEHARLGTRSVVRTWCMRGTLHLVATEDLGWLLTLLGPVFVEASRSRLTQLKLDEDTCAKGIRIIRNALAKQGPLIRHELARQLAPRGINTVGQAPIHLIGQAALQGIVCLGPDRGAKPTYVLIENWIGRQRAMSPDAARAELAHRYLNAYGPAGPHDLAAWSGLTIREARTAWKFIVDQLIEVEVAGRPAWMLKTQAAWLDEPPARHPIVRLLPSFDTYLLGYSSRDLAVAPRRAAAGGSGRQAARQRDALLFAAGESFTSRVSKPVRPTSANAACACCRI